MRRRRAAVLARARPLLFFALVLEREVGIILPLLMEPLLVHKLELLVTLLPLRRLKLD